MKKSLYQKFLEALRDNPGASVKELASLTGLSVSKLRVVVYKLKTMGYVERAGKGYIVTERGLKFLEYLSRGSQARAPEETGVQPLELAEKVISGESDVRADAKATEVPQTSVREQTCESGVPVSLVDVVERLRVLERRVQNLETQVKNLEKAITATQRKYETRSPLEALVMHYSEAIAKYGPLVDKMVSEGKVVRVGSLVVDAEFYNSFKSKFPIKLVDLEKLSAHEKQLLEEMRKEALVVLHAGKEYRLVE